MDDVSSDRDREEAGFEEKRQKRTRFPRTDKYHKPECFHNIDCLEQIIVQGEHHADHRSLETNLLKSQ